MVEELAIKGNEVYFQYNSNCDKALELEQNFGAIGIHVSLEQVFKENGLNRFPKECDILVNCIGKHIVVQEAEKVCVDDLDELLRINVEIPFLFIQYLLPYMKRKANGCIVNLSSICGKCIGENNIPYILSKHALSALTKCIAKEYGKYGIRCNEVTPGAIYSKMNDTILSQEAILYGYDLYEYIQLEKKMNPSGDFLQPADVVKAIKFLISDDSRSINGLSLVIDNGQTI